MRRRVPVSFSFSFVVAVLAAAIGGRDAPAQESGAWPELSITAATRLQDGARGAMPTREDAASQARPVDVFQVKRVDVKPGELKEERPVGEYDQPEWTTQRRFPSTRVYLQTPPGGVQFEQWFEFRKEKHSSAPDETRLRQELEFGLGHGLQLDLYMRELHTRDGVDSTYRWAGYSAELRWAPWKWDEVFGNPTLYFEWIFNEGDADKIEPKLLFGGELASGLHWGLNLIHERTLAGEENRTEEYAAAASISKTIVDEFFSAGVTSTYSYESAPVITPGSPTERERTHEWMLGPSIQLIPHPRAALTIEPLWGLTSESHRSKVFVVFSWHF